MEDFSHATESFVFTLCSFPSQQWHLMVYAVAGAKKHAATSTNAFSAVLCAWDLSSSQSIHFLSASFYHGQSDSTRSLPGNIGPHLLKPNWNGSYKTRPFFRVHWIHPAQCHKWIRQLRWFNASTMKSPTLGPGWAFRCSLSCYGLLLWIQFQVSRGSQIGPKRKRGLKRVESSHQNFFDILGEPGPVLGGPILESMISNKCSFSSCCICKGFHWPTNSSKSARVNIKRKRPTNFEIKSCTLYTLHAESP